MDSVFYTDEGDRINKPNEEIIQKFVEITEIENKFYTPIIFDLTIKNSGGEK